MINTIAVKDLAQYVVSYAFYKKETPLTNLKLNKIMYLIYKKYHAKTNKILFESDFEYWKYGPVIPDVHYVYTKYGVLPIIFDVEKDYIELVNHLNTDTIKLINYTIDSYIGVPTWDLVEIVQNKCRRVL